MDHIITHEVIELCVVDESILTEIESINGKGTQLISMYIRSGSQPGTIISQISDELSRLGNIKDRTLASDVKRGLLKIKSMIPNPIPENGVALFAGVDVTDELKYYSVVPSKNINHKKYLCSNKFETEPLRAVYSPHDRIAIISFGRSIYFCQADVNSGYNGSNLELLTTIENKIPRKHNKGGQSSNRFQHMRATESEKHANEILSKICSLWSRSKSENDCELLCHSLIYTGNDVFYNNYLKKLLEEKRIKCVFVTSPGGLLGAKNGLEIALRNGLVCVPRLKWELDVITELFNIIGSDNNTVLYGESEIIRNVDNIKYLFVGKDKSIQYNIPDNIKTIKFKYYHSQFDTFGDLMAILYCPVDYVTSINDDSESLDYFI